MRSVAWIAVATIVSGAVLAWVGRASGAASAWFAVLVVWVPMVAVGLLSRVVTVRLPPGYHRLRPFELDGRVYERVGVRVAKSALRRGPLAVFNPQLHLPAERTPAELAGLGDRMREAEASHAVLFVATLVVVGHAVVRGWWVAAVLTLVCDVVMNLYPVMLQRYNRAQLAERFHLTSV